MSSVLKTIFRVFKASGLYESYTDAQRSAFNELCDVYLNSKQTKEESEVIRQLEMKVSRRVLSASIHTNKLIVLLRQGYLKPGDLELVNVLDDIDPTAYNTFLNVFIECCSEKHQYDMDQILHFPQEAEEYLTDENLERLHQLQTIKENV